MATGYTRIGKMLIPYEKPDPVKPAKKAKKAQEPKMLPVAPLPEPEPEPEAQKSFLEAAVQAVDEVVRPKTKRTRKSQPSSD